MNLTGATGVFVALRLTFVMQLTVHYYSIDGFRSANGGSDQADSVRVGANCS